MSYYLVCNKNLHNNNTYKYNFIYGSESLDDIFDYINIHKLQNISIYEYKLQGYECYFEVRNNNHFFVYNQPPEIVKPIQEKLGIYNDKVWELMDDLHELEFEEAYTLTINNHKKKEILNEIKYAKEQFHYYGVEYSKLYEVYGVAGNRKVDDNYKFREIRYFN